MNRLFFALWPDDISRQRCAGILHSMKMDSAKRIPLENLHVTLVFLGNVPLTQLADLKTGAATLTMPELAIRFDRLGYWKRSRILCLTASEVCPALHQLAEGLKALAQDLSITVDNRQFKPHITLSRDFTSMAHVTFEPVIWRSRSFCLVASHSMPNQPSRYEILREWPPVTAH